MAENSSTDSSVIECFLQRPASLIFTSFFISHILLFLPLCTLIIYLGLQRWRQQRSTSAAAAVTSHSDVFTYHVVAMELIEVLSCIINVCGIYGHNTQNLFVGYGLWLFTWYGETFFHVLTCVERYLAVVHPVTYLSLRGERGTRIRNISIGCVWLLSFGSIINLFIENMALLPLCMLISSLTIIFFCSFSVLCVLIRPGPGEQGGDRGKVDQSKRRAFHVILAILGVMLLKCFGNLLWLDYLVLEYRFMCLLSILEVCLNFPGSLVLPLLFLHRAGALTRCKKSIK